MADEGERKVVMAHCNKCVGERRHELLHSETIHGSEIIDGQFSVDWGDRYDMLKCRGCESVTLRHQYWFSEDMEPDGRPAVYTNYYPPAVSRTQPRWLGSLDVPLGEDQEIYIASLLKEIYSALHNDARRLAAMGTRALIEQMMIHKVGDHGSFAKNLDEFHSKGFISAKQKDVLETILDAGHATIHRAFHPSKEDLETLIDITESVVEIIYAHTDKTRMLQKRVPDRKAKSKKAT